MTNSGVRPSPLLFALWFIAFGFLLIFGAAGYLYEQIGVGLWISIPAAILFALVIAVVTDWYYQEVIRPNPKTWLTKALAVGGTVLIGFLVADLFGAFGERPFVGDFIYELIKSKLTQGIPELIR